MGCHRLYGIPSHLVQFLLHIARLVDPMIPIPNASTSTFVCLVKPSFCLIFLVDLNQVDSFFL